jgi:hypothetical protein
MLHVEVGLQFAPCKVISISGEPKAAVPFEMTLQFERPVAYGPGERIVLMDIDSKGPRVIGHATVQ